MKRAGSHGSMVDENPFFQALLLARAIDQIKGQSEERRALLDVLAVSSQGLMGTKEIIKNKIGRERGMRSLQPEDSGDLVSILDKYFNIVEARMNSVEELITFLNRLNCSASADFKTEYDNLMNNFWDKMNVAQGINHLFSGKPMRVREMIKLWDSHSKKWTEIAEYGTKLDDFTEQVLKASKQQIKALILDISPIEKDRAAAVLDKSTTMERLLLQDPLGKRH